MKSQIATLETNMQRFEKLAAVDINFDVVCRVIYRVGSCGMPVSYTTDGFTKDDTHSIILQSFGSRLSLEAMPDTYTIFQADTCHTRWGWRRRKTSWQPSFCAACHAC